ncbi:unnamed protein product [Coffea canephora]|uniref:Major facilitator superfamily (MFS) profile domain-containing protein n=1 Tax=Coffea canephora TaxID=49390 RepID=A0A068UR52_COFCA|nr:unnamed protein product [Coffea canephora]
MAISTAKGSRNLEAVTPLLVRDDDEVLEGYVDYRGYPSKRSKSGGWRSASLILGGGSLERFAFRGIECNLVNYLTGPLGQSMAIAAGNVNLWTGLGSLMPVFGAIVADSFLGLYQTNIISSILYILGLGFSTLAVALISNNQETSRIAAVPSTELQVLFFASLYLVALAQGYQSTIQVFGADQFDRQHQEESKANTSFFNWWLFGLSLGVALAYLILPYIQENIGWGIGFGIPCLAMVIGLVLLLLGHRTYRFAIRRDDTCPCSHEDDQEASQNNPQQIIPTHEFPNKVLHAKKDDTKENIISGSSRRKHTEVKKTLKLLPIWSSCLMYAIAWAQVPTFFTKQATGVDKSIGQSFNIPSASLRVFIPLTTMCCTPIYDRVFVPLARIVTENPSGITEFQRIKIGMTISVLDMVIAALVEKKRLGIAQEYGLIDIPNSTVPMSFWLLVPTELRSIGLSLSFGALGVGNFLSSLLIFVIDEITSQNGRDSWFSNNLNRAHLDYFYWLLAGLGFLGLVAFAFLEKSFSKENISLERTAQA